MLVSSRIRAAEAAFAGIKEFYFSSRYAERRLELGVCDFTFGNPKGANGPIPTDYGMRWPTVVRFLPESSNTASSID